MSEPIRAVRGMNDILPDEAERWETLEELLRDWLRSYGYRNVRTPVLEHTALFRRAIGEATDIVEKEMYSFIDELNKESLTLRPEATASIARAAAEHSLLYGGAQRLYYVGPMYRHERPQKGRYRQFHQVGAEALGFPGPDIDAELLLMCARLWDDLNLSGIRLQLNCLGSAAERAAYRRSLVVYLQSVEEGLDEDSKRRLHTNPLRVLADRLGAQGTVCAGGRYDGLLEQVGGKPAPACGWAMGLERLLALVSDSGERLCPDVYLVNQGEGAARSAFRVAEALREAGFSVTQHCGGGSFKSQMKKADASGAPVAVIVGDEEARAGEASIKALREERGQFRVPQERLADAISDLLFGTGEKE